MKAGQLVGPGQAGPALEAAGLQAAAGMQNVSVVPVRERLGSSMSLRMVTWATVLLLFFSVTGKKNGFVRGVGFVFQWPSFSVAGCGQLVMDEARLTLQGLAEQWAAGHGRGHADPRRIREKTPVVVLPHLLVSKF